MNGPISLRMDGLGDRIGGNLATNIAALKKSTERLATGLRIRNASDDAAGLAIREQMRSDIAAYSQGIRNINDAISMLQTADGALSVIDEKLIRMKELAEQAATGTYNDMQRSLIENEFLLMGSEIDRITSTLNFNNFKIINVKINSESKNIETKNDQISNVRNDGKIATIKEPSDIEVRDNYTLPKILNVSQDNISVIKNFLIDGNSSLTIKDNHLVEIKEYHDDGISPSFEFIKSLNTKDEIYINFLDGFNHYSEVDQFMFFDYRYNRFIGLEVKDGILRDELDNVYANTSPITINNDNILEFYTSINGGGVNNRFKLSKSLEENSLFTFNPNLRSDIFSYSVINGNYDNAKVTGFLDDSRTILNLQVDLDGMGNYVFIQQLQFGQPITDATALRTLTLNFTVEENTTQETTDISQNSTEYLMREKNYIKIHFGSSNFADEDYYYINKADASLDGLDLRDVKITTQDEAQKALRQIDKAIEKKDTIRAYYGAMQNRLENTISSLQIESENLQRAESRISDVNIAQETINFVKSQVLATSSIAMLSQANSMNQLVLKLLS